MVLLVRDCEVPAKTALPSTEDSAGHAEASCWRRGRNVLRGRWPARDDRLAKCPNRISGTSRSEARSVRPVTSCSL